MFLARRTFNNDDRITFCCPVIQFQILAFKNERNKSKRLINFNKLNLYDFLLLAFLASIYFFLSPS